MRSNPISLTMFPAVNGDCLLVTIDKQLTILIDIGYKITYQKFLKPILENLAQHGEVLDYCIITHTDADHIEGAIKGLFLDNGSTDDPKIIPIAQVWHNSYRHLNLAGHESIDLHDQLGLKAMVAKGIHTTSKIEHGDKTISNIQGSYLSAILTSNKYNWNADGQNGPIMAPLDVKVNEQISIKLLSPTSKQLQRLSADWKRDLLKLGIKKNLVSDVLVDEAFEYWMAQDRKALPKASKNISADEQTIEYYLNQPFDEDNSPTNGSSIAFVLEIEKKRILLLGDAHPSVVEENLKRIYDEEKIPLWFDCIKISHHGSFNNTSPSLLNLIDSNCFLISTDGSKHAHPDPETIAWIVSRPLIYSDKRCLYFNYNTPTSRLFTKKEWQEKYHYEIQVPESVIPTTITL